MYWGPVGVTIFNVVVVVFVIVVNQLGRLPAEVFFVVAIDVVIAVIVYSFCC